MLDRTRLHSASRTYVRPSHGSAGQKGFQRFRRWAVEHTLAWLTARRLARDYERHPATFEAMIRWAAIHTMRRLARGGPATRPGHGHSNTKWTTSQTHQGRSTCGNRHFRTELEGRTPEKGR
jgi:hypothetical protein